MRAFIFLWFALASVSTYAQAWKYITTSSSGVNYSIDITSIQMHGGLRDFVQLSNHPNGYKYEGKLVYSVKTFRTVNCENNMYKSNYLIGYSKVDGLGDIVLVDKNPDEKWVMASPDSVSSSVQMEVCK